MTQRGYTPTPGHLTRHPQATIANAGAISPTASSSPHRITRPRTGVSSITRHTAARPIHSVTNWIQNTGQRAARLMTSRA